jgi:hypothetical protein
MNDKNYQIFKNTNHLISSTNCVCSIAIFSSSIHFYNVNNNFKRFHKLQMYLNSYIHLAKQWSYVEFIYFVMGSHSRQHMIQEILNLSIFFH